MAGLSAQSPLLVGAIAAGAAVVGAVLLARTAASRIGAWIADACAAASIPDALPGPITAGAHATLAPPLARVPGIVLELGVPLLGAIAIAAIAAHLAQTRAFWLPRRRIPGAPAAEPTRTTRAAFELAATAVVAAATFGWLWSIAPRLAALVGLDANSALASAGALVASMLATCAIAWSALGVADALARHAALANALAMTPAQKREDDRLAAADPRWRAQRERLTRPTPASDAVARAALVLVGDDVAVAIAWDPVHQPVPLTMRTGRRARATQLAALARRYQIAVHRDPELARTLADGEGHVPAAHWPRLAEIVAAVRGRARP